ncbi:MAG: hypothetical protein RJA25_82 [Bacteroidota bacterium]
MKKNLLLLMVGVFTLFGCKKTKNIPTDTCTVEITHSLKNPYIISEATQFKKEQATHQYVRFHIYNIEQYQALEKQGVFLLDHPFEIAPDKNLQYPTGHTSKYGVYYGVVPSNVNLAGFDFEKLNDLYMPNTSALSRKNNDSPKQFSGQVKFFDPIANEMLPLKGVQIVIKDVTKTASAITDDNGHFTLSSADITSDTVEILLKFDNDYMEIHTLDMNNLLGIFSANTFSLGFKESCTFTDLNVEIGNQFSNAALQHSCAALHSLNEYKKFAAENSFLMPDKKFLFWLGKEAPISTAYATPMLRNLTLQGISNPTGLISKLFGLPEPIAQVLALIVKDQLPDVYAPFYNKYATVARISFIETLFHELSHASHFAKVGATFWVPYIEYIYTHGGYGERSFANSGIIAVSESWAEDLSNIGLYYIYKKQLYLDHGERPMRDWIPYGIYYDLYDSGNNEPFDNVSGITFQQAYNLLTSDVRDMGILKTKLKTNFPTQQNAIDVLFAYYGY